MILFPCLVSLPSGSQRTTCKVYYSPGAVDVWAWNDQEQKAEVIAHSDRLNETERNHWTIDVPDGQVSIVLDPRACGCGHPLRYFRPAAPTIA